jgi:SAM-dependent methyltransferase
MEPEHTSSIATSMTGNSQNELLALAQQVKDVSSRLIEHLASVGQGTPNFSLTSPDIPEGDRSYDALRNQLNDAAFDLLLLVNGPKIHARKLLVQCHDLAAYQIAFDFEFFKTVPREGSMSLAAIAEKTGLDIDRTGRVLRFLASQRVFREVEKDTFAHTRISYMLNADEELTSAGHYMIGEMFEAASAAGGAFKEGVNPFTKRHGSDVWEYYKSNPERAARFAKGLAGITKVDLHIEGLMAGFSWAELGKAEVVDIGGGSGHVSARLAQAFPNLSITVQDKDLGMLNGARKLDLSGVEDRMAFMQYDFFTPQPVAGADVYFMRQVLHNWDDDACEKILRAVVPALEKCKPGTPLLINEGIVPEPGTRTRFEEGMMRQIDIFLMVAWGAKQRTVAEFGILLKRADPRFQIVNVHSFGTVGLLEVHLLGQE